MGGLKAVDIHSPNSIEVPLSEDGAGWATAMIKMQLSEIVPSESLC